MTTVQMIFPVLRGRRRFVIEKGRRWSVIEHLLLDAVAKNAKSATELGEKANLPRRVVVEAFIRLMRAGWVEIELTAQGPLFKATVLGAAIVSEDELPAATTFEPRWRGFAIDQVTGCVFHSRDLNIRGKNQLPTPNDDQIVIQLPASSQDWDSLGEVFAGLEGQDEVIVGVDPSAEKLVQRFAVVTVKDGALQGLPSKASPALRSSILEAAGKAVKELGEDDDASKKEFQSIVTVAMPDAEKSAGGMRKGVFENADLIVDGPDHKKIIETAIKDAAKRIIIHSTFITESTSRSLLPTLLQAAAKGTKIDILWGQEEDRSTLASSKVAAQKLADLVAEAGRSHLITVHPFSTYSHAKIIVADNGKGGWYALVGSCNWLASSFGSFEVSMRLREPAIVGELLIRVASMSLGRAGLWHSFAIELTALGRRIAALPPARGRTALMRILYTSDHAEFILEAKDRAKRRLFVTSHRIGIAGKPMVLLPALTAAKKNNVASTLYYGRTTGPLSGSNAAELTRQFRKQAIEILPIHRPRLHAKVFGWDDDALSVSSLNWLSADPPENAPLREIGVFVEAPKITDYLIRRFEQARIAGSYSSNLNPKVRSWLRLLKNSDGDPLGAMKEARSRSQRIILALKGHNANQSCVRVARK